MVPFDNGRIAAIVSTEFNSYYLIGAQYVTASDLGSAIPVDVLISERLVLAKLANFEIAIGG